MYYLVYSLLYLLSLLPFFILYGISDFAALILGRIVRYRREVVLRNIAIAFPEKTDAERIKIARQFYRNFIDNFLETLKVLSISGTAFDKRMQVDMSGCNKLAAEGKNIQFNSGHQMNWEYASLAISRHLKLPWLAVYKKIASQPIERLFLKIRSKFGATMVALEDYSFRMPTLMKQQYALGLIADQNPAFAHKSYWLNFFNKPAPFLTGTDKGARRAKTAVVFVNVYRIKRGYFKLELEIVTEDASEFADGELTRRYRDFLEKNIRRQPANYLWSHRRWKHEYHEEYKKKWIDV
ncbi:lysophospholipid acyltransferase family protein [Ferruginibacter sp. HRS2-29]|uniref:lysophospholipid acyltransferase family protein n=1 Tax=Ferruginibacter sp. HRS2-29 TaxID=2487334 RepID=UPI0020CF67D6|nr:lipid A biosynthesis acyltransferase [Ferruginibacter sp. HRS2-29]MCP9752560.1 lipid A biosynthesis acyltransferase [Ferruginibacter sp. HRS2-29]